MKKYTFLLTVLFTCMQIVSFAQYDAKAGEILDAMSAKYKKIPSYRANFSTSLVNESEGVNETFSGEITVKGNKYILDTDDQLVINNGSTVWTYLPDVNEVNIDIYDPSDDEITPSSIFDEYKKDYKYIWMESVTDTGVACDVVDLIPNDVSKNQFFKIKMVITSKDKTLKKWTMFEKSGNKHIYIISQFKDKITVTDAYFNFDASKYPDVEIVDLR